MSCAVHNFISSPTTKTDLSGFEGFATLNLYDDGALLEDMDAVDQSSIVVHHDAATMALSFMQNLSAPVVIHADTTRVVSINIASNASVHLIIIAHGVTTITVTSEPHSEAHVYLAGGEHEHLRLTANIAAAATIRVFELGAHRHSCRRELSIGLNGSAAQFNYVGLDQMRERETKSTRLIINHHAPDTKSSQIIRGIYADEAASEFLGRVVVVEHARNSSAAQLYKAIILGEKAKATVLPELVIDNHDITASHGASIGELDDEALFYLRSRGLSMSCAQALLIESIAQDLLATIDEPRVREAFTRLSADATTRLLGERS